MDEALPVEAKLQYNSDEKTWTIANMTDEYWGTFDDVDEIAGSQTVFGPSEKAVKAAKDSDFKNEMTVFIEDYTRARDRKSTRLNSSHVSISYAVSCLK